MCACIPVTILSQHGAPPGKTMASHKQRIDEPISKLFQPQNAGVPTRSILI